MIDAEGRPVGVVSLRGLLVAKRSAKLGAIMIEPIVVTVDATLDDLQDLFDRHSFLGLPVVEADDLVWVGFRPDRLEELLR